MKPVCKQTSVSFPSQILRHQHISLPDAILQLSGARTNDVMIEEKAEGPGSKDDSFLHINSYR